MRRLALLMMVAAGVGVGHTATYAFFGHHDAHGLAHAYPIELALAAAAVLLAVLLWSVVQHVRGRHTTFAVSTLLLCQVGGFAALETGERLAAAGLALDEPALWVGLVLQAAVAVALRHGFAVLPRLVAAAFSRRRHPLHISRSVAAPRPASLAVLRGTRVAGVAGPRAPPAAISL